MKSECLGLKLGLHMSVLLFVQPGAHLKNG